ncbi:hypothetical protein BMS93_02370 [Leuconostoc pseudomesenteroides]|uniref:hypothetical protein n=1 Tax=Leuconostoc falkenbergense TaxID=2766470 RepID=UPI0009FF2FCE|nr:hypothetical protein BMS86_02285 [Leuconostoc pseudomesenteroides]ORI56681.1 hypothetical protein BMS87_01660 [Leuconostoc pseudomesenteroides]ORI76892.1 hypothetical protein BMS89_01840 [Leuconostoc pseudomesenteroides]ORI83678.1 hypothetical protein BMS93_02370 [Leuconostoc pseudomesenteroides]
MNKKSALTLGSIGGVLVILIIIIAFIMMGQHKTSSQSTSSKLPKINQAKVMKRIDYEIFSMNNDGRYVENVDNNPAYVDGEKVGDRTITGLVYDSVGRPGNMDMVGSFNFFKEHGIENLVTIWHKDGNSFVAKGYFVVKETGAKYPFAFEFNAGYMITQEWYGRDIKI